MRVSPCHVTRQLRGIPLLVPRAGRLAPFSGVLPAGAARGWENGLMAAAMAGYGRRMGIFTVMVRRARLRAVAPGVGLAPAR